MFRRILPVLLLVGLATRALPAAQAPGTPAPEPAPPTFRVEANFVEVDAFVTDASGRPVTDLRAADFQLLEDGKPQAVSTFSVIDIPIVRAEQPLLASSPIEPDVHTNLGMDGRLYVFVLDDLHIDPTRAIRVRESLRRFFDRNFAANDLAAVVFTSGRTADGQDFTNNRRLLRAAADRLIGNKLRSATLERLDEYNRRQNGGFRSAGDPVADPLAFERRRNARNTMQSLQKLSDFMAGIRGRRKAMVLVSEGVDFDVYDLFGSNALASDIIDATRDAVAAATRANVSIYAIDPRGLASPGAELIEAAGVVTDDPSLGLGVPSSLDELHRSQDSLRSLAEQTGGFAAVNQNDLTGAFDRLSRDNSSYYLLGYYPANDRRDGKFRKIDVRVIRPGVTVRARRGYVAPRGRFSGPAAGASADSRDGALRMATDSPLPMSGIPMRLFVAPYKGAAPNAAVALALEMGVGGFTFDQRGGTFNDTLDVLIRVIDGAAKIRVNEKATLDMTLMPDTLVRARARGFRVTSSVSLPPGRYQVRISAAEAGGAAGSVVADLDVPDFYRPPLVMSAITLTSVAAGLTPTARVKEDPVGAILKQSPSVAREFSADDVLTLFAEVYENQPALSPHAVDITTELRADGGRAVFSSTETRVSTELQGTRGGYGHTAVIPLKGIAPGLYVVHVAATSRGAKEGGAVARDIQIRVR